MICPTALESVPDKRATKVIVPATVILRVIEALTHEPAINVADDEDYGDSTDIKNGFDFLTTHLP